VQEFTLLRIVYLERIYSIKGLTPNLRYKAWPGRFDNIAIDLYAPGEKVQICGNNGRYEVESGSSFGKLTLHYIPSVKLTNNSSKLHQW
jgi:hypothetical protein